MRSRPIPAYNVRFCESRWRGYVSVDLERTCRQVRLRVVSDAHDPKADIAALKTFAVEKRQAGRCRSVRPSFVIAGHSRSKNGVASLAYDPAIHWVSRNLQPKCSC
jgi:hypothetical protein